MNTNSFFRTDGKPSIIWSKDGDDPCAKELLRLQRRTIHIILETKYKNDSYPILLQLEVLNNILIWPDSLNLYWLHGLKILQPYGTRSRKSYAIHMFDKLN